MASSSSSVVFCLALVLAVGTVGCRGRQANTQPETDSLVAESNRSEQGGDLSQSSPDSSESSSDVFSSQPFLSSSGDAPATGDRPAENQRPAATNVPAGDRPSVASGLPQRDASATAIAGDAIDPPQPAVLIAQQPDAQINLRSQPTTQSGEQGYGLVGDAVQLLQSANGDGGYTWYYVRFNSSGTEGWIRGDFINTENAGGPATAAVVGTPPATAAAKAEDSLGEALDAICGGPENLNTYYQTQTYNVYICDSPNGLIYVGNEHGTSSTVVSQDVTPTATGFVARSGDYTYAIDETALEVSLESQSEPLLQEAVESAQRYQR
ncbi:MAG: SH3 domain-containing protein [Cyanobacteria bacterium J06626_18]